MILSTRLMAVYQIAKEVRVEQASVHYPFAQNILLYDFAVSAPKPFANWHWKSHLRSRQNCLRQDPLHALSQNIFRGRTTKLHSFREAGGKLNQLMIKKRHATFHRGGHAHLVLLHQ